MIFLPRPAPFPRCSEAYGLSAVARRNAVAIFPKRPPTCLLREPRNIVGLTLTDLKTVLSLTKWPIYRASQLYSFLYKDRGKDLWHAHNLPKDLRTELQRDWTVAFGERGRMLESVDKTLKTSFDFGKRGVAESTKDGLAGGSRLFVHR